MLRVAVFGLMALGLCGFGTVAWLATRSPARTSVEEADRALHPKRTIIVTATALRGGTLLKPENIVSQETADAPATAQDDSPQTRADLTGAMLRRSLAAGEPLLAIDIMRPGDHGFLAAVLSPNTRAASVGVDNVSGSAGLIWPGDRVDLILTQSLDNPALPPARRVAAETVLSDVRVIAIDQTIARGVAPGGDGGGSTSSRTVTLEVTQAQAERIAVATRLGRLSLAVRSAEAASKSDSEGIAPSVDIQTTWGGDVSPALGRPAPSATETAGATLRLYQGTGEGKEFKF